MQAQGNFHRLALLKAKLVPLLKDKPSPDMVAALLNADNTLTNSGKPWTVERPPFRPDRWRNLRA